MLAFLKMSYVPSPVTLRLTGSFQREPCGSTPLTNRLLLNKVKYRFLSGVEGRFLSGAEGSASPRITSSPLTTSSATLSDDCSGDDVGGLGAEACQAAFVFGVDPVGQNDKGRLGLHVDHD